MNAEKMRRRAKAALVPTWPQVRTFTAAEVEESERAQREWERGRGDSPGLIVEWMHDIRSRAGFGLHIDLRHDDGTEIPENQHPAHKSLTVTITPSGDR